MRIFIVFDAYVIFFDTSPWWRVASGHIMFASICMVSVLVERGEPSSLLNQDPMYPHIIPL